MVVKEQGTAACELLNLSGVLFLTGFVPRRFDCVPIFLVSKQLNICHKSNKFETLQ